MPRKVYSDPKAFIKAYRRERRQELISKYSLQVAVLFMVLTCGAIYFFTESMRADENRGCIASAYQATKHGGDLEANLAVCTSSTSQR